MGVPADTIKGLKTGQFVIHQREGTPTAAIVHMPTNTLKNRAGMAPEDWKRVLADQVVAYYRKPGQNGGGRPAPETPAPKPPDPGSANAYDPLMIDLDSHLN